MNRETKEGVKLGILSVALCALALCAALLSPQSGAEANVLDGGSTSGASR